MFTGHEIADFQVSVLSYLLNNYKSRLLDINFAANFNKGSYVPFLRCLLLESGSKKNYLRFWVPNLTSKIFKVPVIIFFLKICNPFFYSFSL